MGFFRRAGRKISKNVRRATRTERKFFERGAKKVVPPDIEFPETILGEEFVPPDITDPEVIAAIAAERERQRRRKGRGSTILTGPMGVLGGGPVQRPTLLGQ